MTNDKYRCIWVESHFHVLRNYIIYNLTNSNVSFTTFAIFLNGYPTASFISETINNNINKQITDSIFYISEQFKVARNFIQTFVVLQGVVVVKNGMLSLLNRGNVHLLLSSRAVCMIIQINKQCGNDM